MPSTSSGVEFCQELQDLFSWNPRRLFPASRPHGKRASTGTRPPAFFDKHLSNQLLLKHVKRLPSLVSDIANTVDNAIDAAAGRGIQLPPAEEGLLTAKAREFVLNPLGTVAEDEKAVANYYDKSTGLWCAPVASTLALHPNTSTLGWLPLLMWSQSGNLVGYAIADGSLRFIPVEVDGGPLWAPAVLDSMDEGMRLLYRALRQRIPCLATWEFKSLAAGSEDTMIAIPGLSNDDSFKWTTCSEPHCQSDAKHKKERDKVAEIIPGPDAKNPFWTLNRHSSGSRDDPMLDESSNAQASRNEETTKAPLPTPPSRLSPEPPQNLRRSTRINLAVSLGGLMSRKRRKDVSAQCIVQQVKHFPFSPGNCSVMLTEHAFRHGRKLYWRTQPSLCSIQGITKSFVFASGALRRFMFLTFSCRPPVTILRMGNFTSGYTSPPSKMPWIG
jgi:hypothetical protein